MKTEKGSPEQMAWPARLLEAIAEGAAFENIANALCGVVESRDPGLVCEICLLDPATRHVTEVHGPRLPAEFREAIARMALISASISPAAAATALRQKIAVADIAADARFQGSQWKDIALAHGFRRCQSAPIETGGTVSGTITLYATGADREQPEIDRNALTLACLAVERRRDESALRESEQRLRMIINAAEVGTWDWNLVTGEIAWSERCRQMFGVPREKEVSYAVFLDALHPEDRERTDKAVKEALGGRTNYDIEYRTVWPDGTIRWICAKGRSFVADGADTPQFMRGIALDITERKQAESQAAENSARFEFLAESLPEKIFTTDTQGELTYLNRQWAAYTGVPTEEILRVGWRFFVHPDDMEEKVALWTKALRDGAPFEFEHRYRRADGEYRWHLSRAQPMRKAGGDISLWVGSNIDVDDVKRAHEGLRESESRLRLAMEAGGLGFWDRTVGGGVKWSPEFNRMFGINPDVHESSWEFLTGHIHPEDRERVTAVLDSALREGQDREVEFRSRGSDGRIRWVSARARVHGAGGSGEPMRMIGVAREITERKHFENRLRINQEELRLALAAAELARREAEAANRAKDQFLAVLSHELRTPLTPVLMAAASFSKNPALSDDVREAMEMIQRNIRLEARLIEDLLDLTRIARNKIELQLAPMDLHLAIRRAIEICATDIDSKTHRLDVRLAAECASVLGDFDRLQQVFWNLIKNAVKFTPDGGRIEISSRLEKSDIVVEITDCGIGISPETLPEIFSPFVQASDLDRQRGAGLGLGLAISKATIEAHQGSLEACSPGQNEGATFRVRLATCSGDPLG